MRVMEQAMNETVRVFQRLQQNVGRGAKLEKAQDSGVDASAECERRFRMIADTFPSPLWMSGTDTLYTFVNKNWLEFRGRRLDQEIGNGWVEGLHPEDRERSLQQYLAAFHARRPFRLEYRVRRADGEYRWVQDSGAPLVDRALGFLGYVGSCNDVSETHDAALVRPERRIPFTPLTERERQVLVLIADGHSTKEIAQKLGISYKTADSHRTNIMEKLDIHETATLVRYAIRSGLVQP
jgi:PAS domain S-box-containing protein